MNEVFDFSPALKVSRRTLLRIHPFPQGFSWCNRSEGRSKKSIGSAKDFSGGQKTFRGGKKSFGGSERLFGKNPSGKPCFGLDGLAVAIYIASRFTAVLIEMERALLEEDQGFLSRCSAVRRFFDN